MFRLERQVLMTYITWRWIWLFVPLVLLMMVVAAFSAVSHRGDTVALIFSGVFGLGMPIMICIQWFVAVAKWQFANPRARLIPGYTGPHLSVIGAVLATLLVVNPLVLSLCLGISPLGPLAYALLLGGLFLQAIHINNNSFVYALPAIVIFFSSMYPATSQFWFSDGGGYVELHFLLAVTGLGMVIAWLWRLANLTEEMDDYQVMPLGTPGSLSRLEQVEQRRMQGRKIERGIWGRRIIDFWHDQMVQRPMTPAGLAEYGWGQIPGGLQTLFVGLGCLAYGIVLPAVAGYFDKPLQTTVMIVLAAIAIPAVGAGVSLRQRRPRLAQELLRPASREEYVDGLLKSLAKQAAWMWLSLSCAALIVAMVTKLPSRYDLTQLVFGYLLWVPSFQLFLFAIAIYLASWRSSVAFFFVGYAILVATLGIMVAWASLPSYLFDFYEVSAMMGVLFALVGWWLIRASRGVWLREELG